MKAARALRLFLALVLLSAQQAALSHQLWHLGDKVAQPAQGQLCHQHAALDTVAGAVDCPAQQFSAGTAADFNVRLLAPLAATKRGLAPSSRGPPTLS